MILLENVTKCYNHFTAISELNLHIPQGQLFGFIGPNGAGKTTTIKLLSGLLKPTTGKITISGIDLARNPVEAKAVIGLIPDKPFIYEKLSGKEFLRFVASLYRVSDKLALDRINAYLQMFELEDWADYLIESYSQGMKQKLIISSALIHEPKVIVVDEPMVGLDPKGIKIVKNIFHDLCSRGVTIFMSTHSLEIAQELCHEIGIIHKGKLIARGNIDELRAQAHISESGLETIFLQLTEKDKSN
ncbi:MAG: ABC transporter ATP-binding protein [Candidatus Tectomicrobia bacterium]|uniref:ABC transporter ATP-binding protein n=1 Tax=Tectimicrobiota bacterium TaxID=2528274 RepID=A0A933LR06_UNCTE|nr:ABC transporter ATP-binding protein [Candidatus Tectomicrobia bacterium]